MRPLLALLGAAVFLGGQLSASIHLATETHTVCAEHGEIVHGEVHAAGEPGDGPGVGAAEDHEHDACLVAVAPRTPVATVATITIDEPLARAAAAPDTPSLQAPLLLAERRYHFAPKQSPPV